MNFDWSGGLGIQLELVVCLVCYYMGICVGTIHYGSCLINLDIV